MKRYLIIGNGVAGTTAAEHIRQQDDTGEITIFTDENFPFYYRLVGGGGENLSMPFFVSATLTCSFMPGERGKFDAL